MKIRILGFEWFWGEHINLSDLFHKLDAISKEQIAQLEVNLSSTQQNTQLDRIIALNKKGEYWTGVFIRIKDVSSFCKLMKDGGRMKLTSQLLEDDSKMVDVNFFIIHETTGRGLYQHYHQSSWINPFCHFCKTHYDLLVKEFRESLATQARVEKWKRTKLRDKTKGLKSLRYEIIPKPGSFPEFVKAMQKIRKISFEYSTYDLTDNPLRVVARYAHRARHHFSFGKHINLEALKNDFLGQVKSNAYKSARVEGLDASEMEVVYNLTRNYDYFGEYEYDDIIKEADLDFENIHASLNDSKMIQRLLNLAKKQSVSRILEAEE